MARMKKEEVIKELGAKGIKFDKEGDYDYLCKLLNESSVIRLINKLPKRNTFLSDSYRNERDAVVLNAEIGKREHKGKIKTITTIKHMDIDQDGYWVTNFIIELKEIEK